MSRFYFLLWLGLLLVIPLFDDVDGWDGVAYEGLDFAIDTGDARCRF